MNLFFFNLVHGSERTDDDIGLLFETAEQAFLQGVAAARAMTSELVTEGINPGHCAFEITDREGTILFSIYFSELWDAKREPTIGHGETVELTSALEETNRRVVLTNREIAATLIQARSSLKESRDLLRSLDRFTR